MNRRALTIFAVLFAAISLLAVAVIPHHHHTSGICFHNPHHNHHDDGCTHHEENDESDRSGTCILKADYLLPQTSEHNKFHFQDHHYKNISIGFQAILPGSQTDIRVPVRKLIFCIHSASSGSFKYLPSSGLRAPPLI